VSQGEGRRDKNASRRDSARDYRFAEAARNDEILPPELRATFEGYPRPNGKTGTRNYIGILTSVNSLPKKSIDQAFSTIIRKSTARSRSFMAAAVAWRLMARAGTCCGARNGAT